MILVVIAPIAFIWYLLRTTFVALLQPKMGKLGYDMSLNRVFSQNLTWTLKKTESTNWKPKTPGMSLNGER